MLRATGYNPIKTLQGHRYGIDRIIFSPDTSFLITFGDANDRGMFVWDWRNEVKISQNRISKPVTAVAFADNGDFFVTAGYQHLKFWHMDPKTKKPVPHKEPGKKVSNL